VFAEARVRPDFYDPSLPHGLWRCVIIGHTKVIARTNPSGIIEQTLAFDLLEDEHERKPSAVREGDPVLEAVRTFIGSDPDPAGLPSSVAWDELPAPSVMPDTPERTLAHLRTLGVVPGDDM
jgi:hypothetical protein